MDVISSGIIDLITRISKLFFVLPALFRCSQTVNDFIWLLGQCYAGMCDFLYQTNVITSLITQQIPMPRCMLILELTAILLRRVLKIDSLMIRCEN
jgi:hypothetical protein